MDVSTSMAVVWQIAGQESVHTQYGEIQPEHFFIAILKLADLPVPDMAHVAPGNEAVQNLAADVNAVKEVLGKHQIKATEARRAMRSLLGNGGQPHSGGALHRSAESRRLFEDAARRCMAEQDGSLSPAHVLQALLAAPTEKIANFLAKGKGSPPKSDPAAAAPAELKVSGDDLCALIRSGALQPPPADPMLTARLIHALDKRRSWVTVLCVADQGVADAAVVQVANQIVKGAVPPSLAQRRIVDLSKLDEATADDILFGKQGKYPDVIFFAPQAHDARVEEVFNAQNHGGPPPSFCLIKVDFRRGPRDNTWMLADFLTARPSAADEIPDEL